GMTLDRLAKKTQTQAPELLSEAKESQQMLQQLSHDIRTTSYLLHPPLLDETGLATAIEIYAKGLTDRGGPVITVEIPKDMGRLPSDLELVIFRIVQESLTNVVRHSGSKTAAIRMETDSEQISIQIRDAGKGIPSERLAAIQSQGSGVGVRGMRERIRQFGGQMNISSTAQGTTVELRIPLRGQQE
ncbi:MAG TPA: sensor histidine kinase, partial [Candidatus Acidoferrum sp.]